MKIIKDKNMHQRVINTICNNTHYHVLAVNGTMYIQEEDILQIAKEQSEGNLFYKDSSKHITYTKEDIINQEVYGFIVKESLDGSSKIIIEKALGKTGDFENIDHLTFDLLEYVESFSDNKWELVKSNNED